MNNDDIIMALDHLRIEPPYGFAPGSNPGGMTVITTKAEWDSYQWNPPGFLPEIMVPDPDALPKPTWATLVAAASAQDVVVVAAQKLQALRQDCHVRIIKAYGSDSFDDEVGLRLRQGQTAEQDAERERLRTKYAEIKGNIEATTTVVALDAIVVDSDETWAE